jgi:hypothetical protein
MEIIREMMNKNNTERECRYVIIANVNGIKETVHAPMILGREEAKQSCDEQLAVIESA